MMDFPAGLSALSDRYDVVLCDVWGVIHNGVASFPQACDALTQWGQAKGPVVLISLLWKRMTRNGALAGMLVGAVTVVVWKEFIGLGLYEIIPGFILASIAIYVVSKLGAEPAPSIVKRFEEADADYHAG